MNKSKKIKTSTLILVGLLISYLLGILALTSDLHQILEEKQMRIFSSEFLAVFIGKYPPNVLVVLFLFFSSVAPLGIAIGFGIKKLIAIYKMVVLVLKERDGFHVEITRFF